MTTIDGIKELTEDARLVEVILFLENTPLSLDQISSLTKLGKEDVLDSIKELQAHSKERNSGLALIEEEGFYSFQPTKDLYPRLKQSYGRKVEKRLSKAVLEVLSIVAYSQPVTRQEIRDIRGVYSDNAIKILRERDYIKVNGRDEAHKCLFCTTRKFLYDFKLKSIAELPKLSEIDQRKFSENVNGELF